MIYKVLSFLRLIFYMRRQCQLDYMIACHVRVTSRLCFYSTVLIKICFDQKNNNNKIL